MPGPGEYTTLDLTAKNPSPGRRLTINQTIKNKSESPQFKSKVQKGKLYEDEEKRIQRLYGEKKNLKYQIKLNDEVLEKTRKSKTMKDNAYGKLIVGPNFSQNI